MLGDGLVFATGVVCASRLAGSGMDTGPGDTCVVGLIAALNLGSSRMYGPGADGPASVIASLMLDSQASPSGVCRY